MRHKLQSAELPAMGPRPGPGRARPESQGESQDESDVNLSGQCLAADGSVVKLPLSQLPASVQVSGPVTGLRAWKLTLCLVGHGLQAWETAP